MEIGHDQPINWRNEAIAFLALASIKGVGYWTMRSIYEKNTGFWQVIKGGTREEFEALTSVRFPQCESQAWDNFKANLWMIGVEQWKRFGSQGIGLIFAGQVDFPDALSEISDPPYWLFVQGELLNLHCKCVSIVGTRKPSVDGIFLTKLVVAALAYQAMPTVSGLALGIDQIVHEESIRYNIPTIAVLGTGINENYPKGSAGVRAEIVRQGGTIITEYLPDQTYSGDNFVRRNRLQAALCETLIPVEWKIKSGTAHTVEFAYKYGKKIANVFLPHTYDSRPELEFANTAYGAVACEVPRMTDLLLQFIEEVPVRIPETQIELDL